MLTCRVHKSTDYLPITWAQLIGPAYLTLPAILARFKLEFQAQLHNKPSLSKSFNKVKPSWVWKLLTHNLSSLPLSAYLQGANWNHIIANLDTIIALVEKINPSFCRNDHNSSRADKAVCPEIQGGSHNPNYPSNKLKEKRGKKYKKLKR